VWNTGGERGVGYLALPVPGSKKVEQTGLVLPGKQNRRRREFKEKRREKALGEKRKRQKGEGKEEWKRKKKNCDASYQTKG